MNAQLLEKTRYTMPRKPNVDQTQLLPFAKWLMQNIDRRGYTVQSVADYADMHVSQLHKIIKSYAPAYAQYQRPGYEKTVLIGKLFSDVPGALLAAGFTTAPPEPTPIPSSVIEFYEGDVTPEERAFVEQTIAMIGNARMRLPTRLGQ